MILGAERDRPFGRWRQVSVTANGHRHWVRVSDVGGSALLSLSVQPYSYVRW